MPRPYDYADEYSFFIIGDQVSPGTVTFSGHDAYENWDIQNAKGSKGSSSQLNGRPIVQFTANIYLADDRVDGELTEFDIWEQNFRPYLEAMTAGPEPISRPVFHPDLSAQHIAEASFGGIGAPIHDGRGGVTWPVKFIEYKPPAPKPIASAKGAAGGGTRTGTTTLSVPDPNAERKARLSSLVDQAKEP